MKTIKQNLLRNLFNNKYNSYCFSNEINYCKIQNKQAYI